MFGQNQNQQQSFPELVGRNAQEAASYISARGLMPVLVKIGQPVDMMYSSSRVRIITDPTGSTVAQVPTIG